MKATLSILGLWRWDETLFDNMSLPDGVDLDTVRDNILYSLGNLEVLYPSAPFMKTMIELWSKTELPTWSKLYEAMQLEYNPLENYDRIEEWTDSKETTLNNTETSNGESNDTGTDKTTTDNNTTRYVAGYNEPSMVTSSEEITKGTVTQEPKLKRTVENTVDLDGQGTEEGTHTGRVHGNIGVTTSQQMLQSQLDLVPKLNIVHYIVNSFKMRFCILVY